MEYPRDDAGVLPVGAVCVIMFDWIRFFDRHGIEYLTSGPNVSKGNVVVHCPFCGSDDPSHHMSVNTEGKGWRCFRKHSHRGKNPVRLVQGLLGCSFYQASNLVGSTVHVPENFYGVAMKQLNPPPPPVKRKPLRLPEEFKSLRDTPSCRPYLNYLVDRGYRDPLVLSDWYGICYANRGPFKGRIVFPVWFENKLVTWTGRTIFPQVALRYKSLSDDREKAESEGLDPAIGPISSYLLWYDELVADGRQHQGRRSEYHTLIMCEGPFDALKVDVLGWKHGIRATCFFTSGPTSAQVTLLHELLPLYKRRILLLDRGTLPNAIRIQAGLSGLVEIKEIPLGLKDPGDFVDTQQLLGFLLDDSKSV